MERLRLFILFLFMTFLLFLSGCEKCQPDNNYGWITGPGNASSQIKVDMNIHTHHVSNIQEMEELLRLSKMMGVTAIRTALYYDLRGSLTLSDMIRMAPNYGVTTFVIVVGSNENSHLKLSQIKNGWEDRIWEALRYNATHYQILNENNNFYKQVNVKEYIKLLEKASKIIHSAGKKVVSSAPTGDEMGLRYFTNLLDEGMADYIDVIAIHSYQTNPRKFLRELHKRKINKPVWVTEFGASSPSEHVKKYNDMMMTIAGEGRVERVFWYVLYDKTGFGLFNDGDDGKLVVQSPLFDQLTKK